MFCILLGAGCIHECADCQFLELCAYERVHLWMYVLTFNFSAVSNARQVSSVLTAKRARQRLRSQSWFSTPPFSSTSYPTSFRAARVDFHPSECRTPTGTTYIIFTGIINFLWYMFTYSKWSNHFFCHFSDWGICHTFWLAIYLELPFTQLMLQMSTKRQLVWWLNTGTDAKQSGFDSQAPNLLTMWPWKNSSTSLSWFAHFLK